MMQEQLGISDLSKPDYGDPVDIKEGEIPVFWACGVTPQAVIMKSRYLIYNVIDQLHR